MKLSVRTKWMATYLAIGAVVFVFVALYLNSTLKNYFQNKFEDQWRRQLTLAGDYLERTDGLLSSVEEIDAWADRTGRILHMRITVIDTTGRVLGDSGVETKHLNEVENHASRPEVIQALRQGFGRSERFSSTVNMALVYLAQTVGEPGHPKAVLRIAVQQAVIQESLAQIRSLVLFASIVGFILIIVFGWLVPRSVTLRIKQMTRGAKRFARGDFSKIVQTKSHDELTALGDALNAMATELEASISETEEERDLLQAILQSMREGVLVVSKTGNILLCNRQFQDMFDISAEVQGEPVQQVLRDVQVLKAINRVVSENTHVRLHVTLPGPTYRSLEAQMAPLGETARLSGLVAVFHDTTQLDHLEKVRRDFVANVSHELRTPLTAIKGYVETLQENETIAPQRAAEFLRTIHKHSERMTKLVDDLLILSRLESLESASELHDVNLTVCIREVLKRFANVIERSGVEVCPELPANLPSIRGVTSEIETALENLLENAIKYGKDGKRIVIAAAERDGEVEVSVRDYGIGIPVEDQPRIFERFYRVDKGRSRSLGGTGLGLSIVKHIVQRHGGQIRVESELGKGASFIFTLPTASE